MERVPQPNAVLHDQRLVEAVFVANLGDALRRRVIARQRQRRIARYQLQQPKHHERSEHKDRQELEKPASQQTPQLIHGITANQFLLS